MATYTSTLVASGQVPKGHHTGLYAVGAQISLTTALSAGDQVQMIKLAPGNRVHAVLFNGAGGAGNDFVANVGVGGGGATASLSAFGSATGIAGLTWMQKSVPFEVTMSDDASPKYTFLTLSFPTVTSTTNLGRLCVTAFLTNDKP